MRSSFILPTWAPWVKPYLIRQFYESDAAGCLDDALFDKVSWSLYVRCDSFICWYDPWFPPFSNQQTDAPTGWDLLIGGRLDIVVDFLDHLSYGPSSTTGIQQNLEEWREKMNRSPHWMQKRK